MPTHEREAGGLLAQAREDLLRGNILDGRRRLEVLVALYPDSKLADEARRELSRIYAQERPNPGERNARRLPNLALSPADPRADTRESVRQVYTPGSLGRSAKGPDSAGEQPQASVRVEAAVQDDFRLSVGDRVFFGEASAELGSRARAVLAAQAQWLKRLPGVPIVIEGHADEAGSNDYNRDVALKRAQAVRARLIEAGLEPGRITAIGHGRAQPVATCAGADCAAHNRRAVTVLTAGAPEQSSKVQGPGVRAFPDVGARRGN